MYTVTIGLRSEFVYESQMCVSEIPAFKFQTVNSFVYPTYREAEKLQCWWDEHKSTSTNSMLFIGPFVIMYVWMREQDRESPRLPLPLSRSIGLISFVLLLPLRPQSSPCSLCVLDEKGAVYYVPLWHSVKQWQPRQANMQQGQEESSPMTLKARQRKTERERRAEK